MATVHFGDDRLGVRFWKFVRVDDESGCWRWTGGLRHGHAAYWQDGKTLGGHVVAYLALVGPIPEGWQVDHLCHDSDVCKLGDDCPHRRCVNPAHLKATTPRENTMRSGAPAATFAVATHCVNGHEFDLLNTYWRPGGGRTCRQCASDRAAAKLKGLRPDFETHCSNGHLWTAENLYIKPTGERNCRTCNRERTRAYRRAKREAA